MKCPTCGLINPSDSILCDCGYNFQLHQQAEPIAGASAKREVDQRDMLVAARVVDFLSALLFVGAVWGLLHRFGSLVLLIAALFAGFYLFAARFARTFGIGWWVARHVARADRRFRLHRRD